MSSAGQAIGGIIGAIVGFVGSGFNPAGAYQGFMIGAGIGGYLDPPKGPNVTGPRLTDLSTQTSTYGTNIPRVYGTISTLGNIFWLQGNALTEVATVSKQKSGGKGGGSKSTVTTYSYFATFAVGLCQGPIAGVRRIWMGANLIYDAGSDDPDAIAASNAAAGFFKVYLGTEDQTADPRIQADKGVANVPAYRGLAYIVFYDYPLKDYGNSLLGAQVKVELVQSLVASSGLVEIPGYPMPDGYYTEMAVASHGMIAHSWANSTPYVYWSQEGKYWHQALLPESTQWRSIAFNPLDNKWIALSSNGYVAASEDIYGARWSAKSGLTSYRGWQKIAISQDGSITLAVADGGNLAVGRGGAGSTLFIEATGGPQYPTGDSWHSLVHNGVVFCLTSYSRGMIFLSETGTEWSAVTLSTVTDEQGFFAATHGSDILIVSGKQSHLSTDNGQTWTVGEMPDFTRWGVTYCGGKWIAWRASGVAGSSGADVSSDGVIWEFKSVDDPPINYSICTNPAKTLPLIYNLRNTSSPKLYTLAIDVPSISTADLSDILSAECDLSGLLETSDIDVSAITGTVRGYRVSETGAIRAALEPLQGAFPFDVVQRGYEIAFLPRGGSSVVTIDEDELGATAAGDKPGVRLTSSREMDSQLPRRVAVKYFDNAREYDISEQYAERLNSEAINLSEVSMPLVMTATEAAGVAESLLYLYWLERYDVSFILPPAYAALEPADVVTIAGDSGTFELRLTQINYTSNGLLECRAKYNNSAIYTPSAQGEEGSSTGAALSPAGASLYVLLDIPCLQDVFDLPGFGAAMCGTASGWPGGVIFRSTDGGQTWIDLQGFADKVPIGFATTALSATARTDIIDTRNRLTVALLAGELFSVTQTQMLNGANYFAIGAHGRWEIVAAQNCDLQIDGSYILSDLLRGRYGTEWAMSLHEAADTVIYLNDADMAFIACETASIGVERAYRGITNGAAIDSDVDQAFTYSGVNLKPLSPVYLNGNRHPSTNDWTLEWTRRTRIDGALRDYVDAALGEDSESYEIDIYNGSGYASVLRTLTASSATVAYTSAQQVTDFGSNQATLYVKVYQLSATVGRGFALTASITR